MYTKIYVLNANVFQNEQPNMWFQDRLRFGRVKPIVEGLICTLRRSGVPRNFVRGGGVQQILLKIEDRENGDLGAVAP